MFSVVPNIVHTLYRFCREIKKKLAHKLFVENLDEKLLFCFDFAKCIFLSIIIRNDAEFLILSPSESLKSQDRWQCCYEDRQRMSLI